MIKMPYRMKQELKNKIENLFKNPASFFWRQLYRIFVIIPWLAAVYLVQLFFGKLFKITGEAVKTCFIITSVIYPKQKELSYSSTRSVYNPEERATQTLKTIESIKEKVPGAKIVLVESGLQENLPLDLAKQVDQYLYVGNNFFVRLACDSRFKSLGEAIMLIAAAHKIKYAATTFFKISGRYFLDENFNIQSWQSEVFRFFYIRATYVSTRLYAFAGRVRTVWYFALIKGLPLLLLDYPIEHILPRFIPKKYMATTDKAGIMGADATTGQVVKE